MPYHSRFRWTVAGPFVLSRQVHEARNPGMSVTVEVVELNEDETDNSQPASPQGALHRA